MFTKKPATAAKPGVQADDSGNETHTGSGQGGSAATDHMPANMARSGCSHGGPGENRDTGMKGGDNDGDNDGD